jgi:hypothetical protein
LPSKGTLTQFVSYFLRLGTFGFGGPIALAARMQKDLVEDLGWLSQEDYTEGLAFSQLSPGPLAAQLARYADAPAEKRVQSLAINPENGYRCVAEEREKGRSLVTSDRLQPSRRNSPISPPLPDKQQNQNLTHPISCVLWMRVLRFLSPEKC